MFHTKYFAPLILRDRFNKTGKILYLFDGVVLHNFGTSLMTVKPRIKPIEALLSSQSASHTEIET